MIPSVLVDGLVIVGLLGMTLDLAGFSRLPHLAMRLHATAHLSSLGLAALLFATAGTSDAGLIARALLIAAFLVLTAPVTSCALGRAHGVATAAGSGAPPADSSALREGRCAMPHGPAAAHRRCTMRHRRAPR